jgi:hypothetical protein
MRMIGSPHKKLPKFLLLREFTGLNDSTAKQWCNNMP